MNTLFSLFLFQIFPYFSTNLETNFAEKIHISQAQENFQDDTVYVKFFAKKETEGDFLSKI